MLAISSNTIGNGCMIGFPGVLSPQLHQPGSHIVMTKEGDSWIGYVGQHDQSYYQESIYCGLSIVVTGFWTALCLPSGVLQLLKPSVTGIAMVIGSQLMTPIMGRLGRKKAHFAATMPIIAGWTIILMSTSVEALIVGRLVQGISFGMMLPLRSVLIGEYTSPKNRGAFLTTVSASQGFGIFLVHLLGSLFTWKTTAILCSLLPIVSLGMIFYSPESPSWLADKGRHEECMTVFRWLRGNDEEDELQKMIDTRLLINKRKGINNIKDLIITIKLKEFYKPIVIMGHLCIMAEFSGSALLACYSVDVLQFIAGKEINANFWMVELDTQIMISNLIAIYIIHKFKRRTMLFFTGALCVSCQVAIAMYVLLKSLNILKHSVIWVPITLINVQYFTVATGMICLPYVIAGEIFPMQFRSFGGSFSILVLACGYFLVTKTFLGLTAAIQFYGTYFTYAGIVIYCLLVVGLLLPETKGKTLQEIEEEFVGKRDLQEDIELKQHINEERRNS